MSCCDFEFGVAASGGQPTHSYSALEEQKLRLAARDMGDGVLQSDFHVPDMHCAVCIGKIERGLTALPYVDTARVNLSNKRVSVQWRGAHGSAAKLMNTISGLGFDPSTFDLEASVESDDRTGRQLLTALGVAGFAAANIMLLSVSVWSGADGTTSALFHLISGIIAAPAIAYAGRPFFVSALKALRASTLNMDVPISLAVLLAFAMSLYEALTGGENAYFDASVTLLFFLLIGRYLDHRMREKAHGAVTRLSRLGAKGASVVLPDGTMHYHAAADLRPGMKLAVAAGERIPVDGQILSASGTLDRSLVTGESEPVTLTRGAMVEAGTVNMAGQIIVEATRTADQSFLAEVVQMMQAAEHGKARYVRIADRLARLYAPAVHLIALVTFVGWMGFGDSWQDALYAAIAVLIITCPCALGLAVPIVHVVGSNRLFANGVMIKDGAAFEKMAAVDTVLFDKTGTLTRGTPSVVAPPQASAADRSAACALAATSAHPFAKAVSRHLDGDQQSIELEEIRETAGLGVEAVLAGNTARLGRRDWVLEIADDSVPPPAEGSEVLFAMAGGPAIRFGLSDALRPDATQTIRALDAAGLNIEILSGDLEAPVCAVAAELGVEKIRFGMKPADKVSHVEALQNAGRQCFVVGDGLNDAPALTAGYVSMAPSSGSDVGRLAADYVFTGDSLGAVQLARATGMATGRLVRQNFAIALAYNCIAVPLAMLGFVTPLFAALAMSASSIAVVANSMRLNLMKLPGSKAPSAGAYREGRFEPDVRPAGKRSSRRPSRTLDAAA